MAKRANPASEFRRKASSAARNLLVEWVGEEKASEAAGRISTALAAVAAKAKDSSDFYQCSDSSVATCVALSALTGIMPSTGAGSLAYLIPQRARQGEQPQLELRFSHRGLNVLARRSGQIMLAQAVGHNDELRVDEAGEVYFTSRDLDNPPTTYADVRGVMVTIKDAASGRTITRGWVPKKLIEPRRAMSKSGSSSYSPWSKWPVEMCMKTGMHYAVQRGWCVIDDAAAQRALGQDTELNVIDVSSEPSPETPPSSAPTLAARLAEQAYDEPEPERTQFVPGPPPAAAPAAPPAEVPGTVDLDDFDEVKRVVNGDHQRFLALAKGATSLKSLKQVAEQVAEAGTSGQIDQDDYADLMSILAEEKARIQDVLDKRAEAKRLKQIEALKASKLHAEQRAADAEAVKEAASPATLRREAGEFDEFYA